MKRDSIINNQFGMTMLELMFTLAIFSLLFGVLFQFVNVANQSSVEGEATMRLRQQAQYSIDALMSEVKNATVIQVYAHPVAGQVNNGTNPGENFFIPIDAASSSYALGIQTPTPTGGTSDRIVFCVTNQGKFIRAVIKSSNDDVNLALAGNPKTIASGVSSFTIDNPASSTFDFHLNFSNANSNGLTRRIVTYGNAQKAGTGGRVDLRSAIKLYVSNSTYSGNSTNPY